ncbi:hypothetical protein B0H14DRAFT_3494019 [Mycena olivaceomarginata]|nr:hypothetical protein B0H14DRAFT_3494019 [Mycena olivaceomarginata]
MSDEGSPPPVTPSRKCMTRTGTVGRKPAVLLTNHYLDLEAVESGESGEEENLDKHPWLQALAGPIPLYVSFPFPPALQSSSITGIYGTSHIARPNPPAAYSCGYPHWATTRPRSCTPPLSSIPPREAGIRIPAITLPATCPLLCASPLLRCRHLHLLLPLAMRPHTAHPFLHAAPRSHLPVRCRSSAPRHAQCRTPCAPPARCPSRPAPLPVAHTSIDAATSSSATPPSPIPSPISPFTKSQCTLPSRSTTLRTAAAIEQLHPL